MTTDDSQNNVEYAHIDNNSFPDLIAVQNRFYGIYKKKNTSKSLQRNFLLFKLVLQVRLNLKIQYILINMKMTCLDILHNVFESNVEYFTFEINTCLEISKHFPKLRL